MRLCDEDEDGVDDAGDVAQHREQQADPELHADAVAEEDADRRQQDGQQDLHERLRTHRNQIPLLAEPFFSDDYENEMIWSMALACRGRVSKQSRATEVRR